MDFSCGDRSSVENMTKNNEIPMDFGWFVYIYSKIEVSRRSDGEISDFYRNSVQALIEAPVHHTTVVHISLQ